MRQADDRDHPTRRAARRRRARNAAHRPRPDHSAEGIAERAVRRLARAFAEDFHFLADQRGYYAKAELQCQFDSSGGAVESSTRVGSGVYDFAFTDINVLTEFDARNPDHAASDVFMLYYRSPLCAISFRKAGITKPADLAGRTLGAAQTDGAYRLFPASG